MSLITNNIGVTMKEYLLIKPVKAKPMTRKEYYDLREWDVPENKNPNGEGYLIESEGMPNHPDYEGYLQWLPKEQFEKYCCKTENLSFGAALEAKKLGKLVKRASWPDDWFFLSASTWRALNWEDFIADDWVILD